MYTVEDILARLQDGDNAEKIAAEFTTVLNAAIQKQEEKNKEYEKVEDFRQVVANLVSFVSKYYPEAGKNLEDVARGFDSEDYKAMLKELDMYMDIATALGDAIVVKKENTVKNPTVAIAKAASTNDADVILREFLSKIM